MSIGSWMRLRFGKQALEILDYGLKYCIMVEICQPTITGRSQ
ncbi:MAG: hypothetical protein ABSB22_04065 [Thermodesulfobacteriota bacterium]